jgi:hypothetical protein
MAENKDTLDTQLRSALSKKVQLVIQNRERQVELAKMADDLLRKGASIEDVTDMLRW